MRLVTKTTTPTGAVQCFLVFTFIVLISVSCTIVTLGIYANIQLAQQSAFP